MRICAIKHVPFEGPALIGVWAAERGHAVSESLALTEDFPSCGEGDLVAVMGGPMGADDEVANAWLVAEKAWLRQAIEAGASVLGICLGAQILAEVLGGRVRRNREPEIGWFPVELSAAARAGGLLAGWPAALTVGHWHGDTFDLPPGIDTAASSVACANQAFAVGARLVGLQFHLEWDGPALDALLGACSDELVPGTHVATELELRHGLTEHGPACRAALWQLLDAMEADRTCVAGKDE